MAEAPAATVLVVDDDPRNRALARGYLQPAYRVVEAGGGREALDLLAREPADLVLLDVMMPGMSGFEACRLIKQLPGPFLPVLLLTALGEQEYRNAGLEAGADDFLAKPVDRRELLLRVAAFVRIRRQERTIREQLEQMRHLQALKDDLVSLLVHDLRNPLAGVLGFLHVLEQEARDPAVREDVASALRAGTRLQEAIDDMLQVRLLEDGALQLRREPCPLRALVQEAVATVAGAARERGVSIRVAHGPEHVLELDRALVRRAVENLVVNAIRYSRAGGVVEVTPGSAAGGCVVEVADRGPGVPDEYKPTLFEKFGSVEARRGGTRRGYGMGLYLTRLVATAHGGGVSVSDREGGGAVFRLSLAGCRDGAAS